MWETSGVREEQEWRVEDELGGFYQLVFLEFVELQCEGMFTRICHDFGF